jgi:hypothetical protein
MTGDANTECRCILRVLPTVARVGPYRFFFYSNEGEEPRHVHVERDRDVAKFWLDPPALAMSRGFAAHELREIERIVSERQQQFRKAWDEYFSS